MSEQTQQAILESLAAVGIVGILFGILLILDVLFFGIHIFK